MSFTTTDLNPKSRQQALDDMAATELDVLVIGAGVVGAGAALDAASRGLTVGLVEARDLAAGTSSRSSKLVHGGLRYLKQLNFSLVFEALRERSLILDTLCPHLARPVEFIYPLERKGIDRGYVGLGIGVYDVLGAGKGVPSHHKHMSKKKTLESFPDGKKGHIQGAIKFYEGQLDDARHTMMIARTAAAYGAHVATSARVVGLLRDGDRVVGATVRDLESGKEIADPGEANHQRHRRLDRRHPEDDRRQGPVPGAGVQGRAHRHPARPDQVQDRADHRDREEPAVHHPVPVERRLLGDRHHRHALESRPGAPGGQSQPTSTTSSSTPTPCSRSL